MSQLNDHNEFDDIAALLKATGKRQEPDAQLTQHVRQATYAAWQDAVQANRQRAHVRKWRNWAAAAVVFVGLVSAFMLPHLAGALRPAPALAQVVFVQGQNLRNHKPPVNSGVIYGGDVLSTQGNALLGIKLPDNTLVTLDQNTQITVVNAALIQVEKGRIYIDSPDPNTSVIVATRFGEIVDIGTQYEVAVGPQSLQVSMREGMTKISLAGQTLYGKVAAGFGDVLSIDSQQQVHTTQIPSTDVHWQWAQKAVADLNLQNTTAHNLLHWAGRVTGKKIVYTTAQAQRVAENTHLSGGTLAANAISQQLPSLFKTTTLRVAENANSFVVQESLGDSSVGEVRAR